jgi:glucokinase
VVRDLVIGADVGGTLVKYVAIDDAGGRVLQGAIATDPGDPEATIARLARELLATLGTACSRLRAVGLACAGIVAPESGRLGRSPNLPGWQGHDLRGALVTGFGLGAVTVANDVNAALYGEYLFGAGRGCRQLVMIALGTGVGGGVLIDGRLLLGAHSAAGEIGHMILDPDGPTCSCGNRGCLEAYAGSTALLRRARELAATAAEPGTDPAAADFVENVRRAGTELTTDGLYELAAAGDATAVALFNAAGRWLGQATANLVNVLNPDRVIVGGGLAQAGDLILAPCREVMQRGVMAERARATAVVPAALGPHAAALGVAALARETES